jgi:hypothetical protein
MAPPLDGGSVPKQSMPDRCAIKAGVSLPSVRQRVRGGHVLSHRQRVNEVPAALMMGAVGTNSSLRTE